MTVETMESPMLLRAGNEPQHLLLTLLGDYWSGRGELIPSVALVSLLAEFGASESSSRQAIRRLAARGLLAQGKSGRTTSYGTPPRITAAAASRLSRAMGFGADFTSWDGKWTVVSFSVPEKERDTRRLLRNGLRSMKFGLLNDAMWITPHDRSAQAAALLDELAIEQGSIMRAELLDRQGRPQPVSEVFNLAELEQSYLDFIERHEPTIEWATSGQMTPSNALILRTKLTSEWLSFRADDPELPREILPANWPRARAREVFHSIYDNLGSTAEVRFRQIIGSASPELAKLASHHSSRGGEATAL